MENSSTRILSFKEKLFLTVGVPCIFLCALELILRVPAVAKLINKPPPALTLEMPAWMQIDRNAEKKIASIASRPESIDWMQIFESGPGFRVRLIPGIERAVSNTFSLLPSDRKMRYHVRANSLGFRGPEISPSRAPDTDRILIFGDSSSFGWGVEFEQTYGHLLSKNLSAQRNKVVEVGNFAIPGDSTEYGKLIFDKYISEFPADIVILGFGANDAKDALYPHASQVEKFRSSQTSQLSRFWLRKSALYRTLEDLLQRLQNTDTKRNNRKVKHGVDRKRYYTNLLEMAHESKKHGAKQVLLLSLCTPSGYALKAKKVASSHGYLHFDGQRYLIKQIPQLKSGELLPDMVQELQAQNGAALRSNELFYVTSDACHPNAIGHKLVADKITELLKGSLP